MVDYKSRLLWAMDRAGVDAKHLADAIGVKVQAINKIKAETSKSLSAENNALAAKELGVCPSWLATGSGPRLPIAPPGPQVEIAADRNTVYQVNKPEIRGLWPFESVTKGQWAKLDQEDRKKLEIQVMAIIAYRESRGKTA
jgi:hypothetical protein